MDNFNTDNIIVYYKYELVNIIQENIRTCRYLVGATFNVPRKGVELSEHIKSLSVLINTDRGFSDDAIREGIL